MTPDIILLILLIAVMIVLFLMERTPVDLTACFFLAVIVLLGYVTPAEALSGFSNPAVVTLIFMFVVGAALNRSGVSSAVADGLVRLFGQKEIWHLVAIMFITALLAAVFASSSAVTAILLPTVASVSLRTEISPSRLLIPLAFAAILGSMLTLIGNPANILMSDFMGRMHLEPFRFFDFTPFGATGVALGIVYMVLAGRHFLPRRQVAKGAMRRGADPAMTYRLFERLFKLRVPAGSKLHGRTITASQFGSLAGGQIVSLTRNGRKLMFPNPQEVLLSGDTLVVQGRVSQFNDLQRLSGIEIEKLARAKDLWEVFGLQAVKIKLGNEALLESTLVQLQLRGRYGLAVIGIERQGAIVTENLGQQKIGLNDALIAVTDRGAFERLNAQTDWTVATDRSDAERLISERACVLEIPPDSSLNGLTVKKSRLGELSGLQVIAVIRAGRHNLALTGDEEICAGDRLVVMGATQRLRMVQEVAALELEAEKVEEGYESGDIGVFEVLVSPRSKLLHSTLAEVNFRDRYGLQVLAIWRGNHPYRFGLASMPLESGDALLLHGPRSKLSFMLEDQDFVLFASSVRSEVKRGLAWLSLGALVFMVFAAATGLFPLPIAALTAAVIVILGGAVTIEEAYRQINWQVIFFVATLIPFGAAVENSGAAALLGSALGSSLAESNCYLLLVVLALLASFLSQGLDNTVAVVLLGPVVLELANAQGISPYPLLMAVTLGASIAFLAPFSHKANLLVMGAGGYRARDYFVVGSWLTILLLAAYSALILFIFPLR